MDSEQEHGHGRSNYFARQLLALSVCAAVGVVTIIINYQGSFSPYLLWSGLAVVTLVGFRIAFLSFSLWRGHLEIPVRERSPWQYVILSLPVVLYFLVPLNCADQPDADNTAGVIQLDFEDFVNGANDPDERARFEGKIGVLKGQYAEGRKSNFVFGLFRLKGRHEKPLSVSVVSDVTITTFKSGAWVQVIGEIEYRKREDQDEYYPVLKVHSLNDIVPTKQIGPSFF
jgi:hypothetical protein